MVHPSLRSAVISAEHPAAFLLAIAGDAHAAIRAGALEHVDPARAAFNRTSLASRP